MFIQFQKLAIVSFLTLALSACAALTSHTASNQYSKSTPGKYLTTTGSQHFSTNAPNSSKAANADDMWVRLRENFSWEIPSENPLVTQHRNLLLSKNYYFPKLTEQSQDYIHYVVQSLDERGMPFELALLPAVESFYNPTAYSRSHASGLWQFIPSTGKVYGLKQSEQYDARRDMIASTQAALNLLEYLRDRFHGDWFLALAAYNYGSTNVERAMARNAAEGKPTDYWSIPLPTETRNYVPKLLAIAELIKSPKQYSLQLPALDNKPIIKVLTMESAFSLTQVAQLANLPIERVRRLNAGYAGSVSPQEGPYQLVLPIESADNFQQQYAQLNTSKQLVATTQQPTRVATTETQERHTVQQGETLWGIARHYQVDVHRLANWNNIAANSPLQQGQTLTLFSDQ